MTEIPAGYLQDPQGRLVPEDSVRAVDRLRDELVRNIIDQAEAMSRAIARFKANINDEINAFVELAAAEHDVKLGGKKGNLQLVTFDGQARVLRAVDERMAFDEGLQVAKQLIDECIQEWSEGSRSEIRTLINDAFYVDQAGRINTQRILGLRRLAIDHPKWQKAMKIIGESLQVLDTKAYLRIYRRSGTEGGWQQIPLDVANA